MIDEQADYGFAHRQVDEHRALDAFAPQRPPEAFDLASVCGRRGLATICLMPRFSSSRVNWLFAAPGSHTGCRCP